MAKWTVKNGRRIFKDGDFAFHVQRELNGMGCLSPAEADRMAHTIARLLNADEYYPIIDPTSDCALTLADKPLYCARCGCSDREGVCAVEEGFPKAGASA